MSVFDIAMAYYNNERNKIMDIMTILFGYFVFKSIFNETKNCNIEDNYDYDYDEFDDFDC